MGFLIALMGAGEGTTSAEVTEVELHIDGLSCPFCVFNIERPLKKLKTAGAMS